MHSSLAGTAGIKDQIAQARSHISGKPLAICERILVCGLVLFSGWRQTLKKCSSIIRKLFNGCSPTLNSSLCMHKSHNMSWGH